MIDVNGKELFGIVSYFYDVLLDLLMKLDSATDTSIQTARSEDKPLEYHTLHKSTQRIYDLALGASQTLNKLPSRVGMPKYNSLLAYSKGSYGALFGYLDSLMVIWEKGMQSLHGRRYSKFSYSRDIKSMQKKRNMLNTSLKYLLPAFKDFSALVAKEAKAAPQNQEKKIPSANYDLVEYMVSTISEYPGKKNVEPLFFSLYTLLLHKVFKIGLNGCHNLIDIYVKERIESINDYPRLHSVMIDFLQNFDNVWESACSTKNDGSAVLSNSLYCLAKHVQSICPEYDEYNILHNLEITEAMTSFIHDVSEKFEVKL